jgi:1-aminocyclopropane-1-carboxylate deaminase
MSGISTAQAACEDRIEQVYTGKLFFGLYELIKKDFFKRGSKVIAVHTGGVFLWNNNSPIISLE